MKRKIFLGIGTIAAIAAPVATVISCGKDVETTYTVVIDNSKDKNYVLSTTDVNYQPITLVNKETVYWDIQDNGENQDLDKVLGKNATQKLVRGVKKDQAFSNGLEWLMYDLLLAKDRDIELELKIQDKSIIIPKEIMKEKADDKATATARKDAFTTSTANIKRVDVSAAATIDKTKVKALVTGDADLATGGKYEDLKDDYADKAKFDKAVDDANFGGIKAIYEKLKKADDQTAEVTFTEDTTIIEEFVRIFSGVQIISFNNQAASDKYSVANTTKQNILDAINKMNTEIQK